MTSCAGTSSVSIRSETRISLSIGEKIRTRPGPFGAGSILPRRSTTPRSHSLITLMQLKIQMRKIKMAMPITAIAKSIVTLHRAFLNLKSVNRRLRAHRLDEKRKPLNSIYAHLRAFANRLARCGAPQFAMNQNHPFQARGFERLGDFADRADQLLGSRGAFPAMRAQHQAHQENRDQRHGNGDSQRNPRMHAAWRNRRMNEHQRAKQHGNGAADAQYAVRGILRLQDKQHERKNYEQQAREIHWQHVHGEKREDQRDAADHSGSNKPGMSEFDVQPEHAENQKNEEGVGL